MSWFRHFLLHNIYFWAQTQFCMPPASPTIWGERIIVLCAQNVMLGRKWFCRLLLELTHVQYSTRIENAFDIIIILNVYILNSKIPKIGRHLSKCNPYPQWRTRSVGPVYPNMQHPNQTIEKRRWLHTLRHSLSTFSKCRVFTQKWVTLHLALRNRRVTSSITIGANLVLPTRFRV